MENYEVFERIVPGMSYTACSYPSFLLIYTAPYDSDDIEKNADSEEFDQEEKNEEFEEAMNTDRASGGGKKVDLAKVDMDFKVGGCEHID